MSYAVTAPLVIARDSQGRHHHLYSGAPLPEDVDPEQLKQLVESDMVEKVKAPKADKADKAEPADNTKPTSVKDILAAVGDDKAKAQEYLDEETAKGDDARSSLVEKLQAVVAG